MRVIKTACLLLASAESDFLRRRNRFARQRGMQPCSAIQTNHSYVTVLPCQREQYIETLAHAENKSKRQLPTFHKNKNSISIGRCAQAVATGEECRVRLLSIQRSFRFRLGRVQRRLQGRVLSKRSDAAFGFIHRFVQGVQRIWNRDVAARSSL